LILIFDLDKNMCYTYLGCINWQIVQVVNLHTANLGGDFLHEIHVATFLVGVTIQTREQEVACLD